MNIIFLGSSQFGEQSLRALIANGHKISCVITQPDRAKGRGLAISSTLIKETAEELGLKVFQPPSVNSPVAIKSLKDLNPDLFVIIAYGQLLSQHVLDIPKIMSINAHASLLPKYRGAAPINWAVIKGEKATGVSIMKVVKKMDAGPIILQKEIAISQDDTAITLEAKLSRLAASGLMESLAMIEQNNYKLVPQDAKKASLAPKLKKTDGEIDWNKSAGEIFDLIRGCVGWPGAFTHYKGKLLKIHKAKIGEVSECQSLRVSGEILGVSGDGIVVACGKGSLAIEELQIEGKRAMMAAEFIAGHKISAGEVLGDPSPSSWLQD